LAIFAFKQGMPFTYHVEQGLRAAFASESDYPVELDVEHADRSRFPEEALLNKLVELYRYKYSRRPVDLVIALGGKAPELLLACGKDLFGDIPVVVISSNPKYLSNELKQFNITPLLWGMDFKKTVQLIQDIRPQTKNFFVVSGVSLGDENIYKRVMAALREKAGDLHVQSLKDLAVGNLLQKVSKLPKDSAILFGSYFRDAEGKPYISREILSTISETANAPTFGAVDTYLGHGIVGGSLLSAEYQGKRLANIAIDLLKGEPINDSGTTVKGNLPMFDWQQLRRWGIDEKKLPPGSIVRYRERSIWEDHKGTIIGIGILILA
jgi:ABC-type uncharacterized transport system substrate-binding protein